jgi:hypothetical protein
LRPGVRIFRLRRRLLSGCERELILERQREGIAKAKAEGKYKGRKPTARARAAEIATLKADGVRPTDIARHRLALAGRASIASWIADRVNPGHGTNGFLGQEKTRLLV